MGPQSISQHSHKIYRFIDDVKEEGGGGKKKTSSDVTLHINRFMSHPLAKNDEIYWNSKGEAVCLLPPSVNLTFKRRNIDCMSPSVGKI